MSNALEFLWNGGNTRRFHTVPLIGVDTVGHHSYNVACIIMTLRPDAPAKLLRAALKHDAAEHITGDMPAPTKRGLNDYCCPTRTFREVFGQYEEEQAEAFGVDLEQDLSDEDAWLLKLADSFDGMRFCVQERRMGNRHPKLNEAFENFRSYVVRLFAEGLPDTPELLLLDHLVRSWNNARSE